MNEQIEVSTPEKWIAPIFPKGGDDGEWIGDWRPLPNSYPGWVVEKRLEPLGPVADARKAAARNTQNSVLLSGECAETLRSWWNESKLSAGASACGSWHFHCYRISDHPAWSKWRNSKNGNPHCWWCNSIKQAADHYSWPGGFIHLSAALQSAIRLQNPSLARIACLTILEWGGVLYRSRKTVDWIVSSTNLSQDIGVAAASLVPYSLWNSGFFSGGGVPMNSGSTKIFAAAALDLSGGINNPKQDVLIYDGRVGSALGLLARRLMYPVVTSGSVPPIEYLFLRTDRDNDRKRDPSISGQPSITFPAMNGYISKAVHAGLGTSNRDEVRAWYARHASELIQRVIGATGPHPDFIQAEKALFMLGYDVKYRCDGSLRPIP